MTSIREAEERARQLSAHVNGLATDAEVWCDVHDLAQDCLELAVITRRLAQELQNIERAKPSEWGEDMADQFRPWAQNRARFALSVLRGLL